MIERGSDVLLTRIVGANPVMSRFKAAHFRCADSEERLAWNVGHSRKVLIVEDSYLLAELISNWLRDWGVETLGVLSSQDIVAVETAVVRFMYREGSSHRIIDFTPLEAIAVPSSKLGRRGSQPPTSTGRERVFVAPRPDLLAWVRAFSEQQSLAGIHPPQVAASLQEAYTALQLVEPKFEPVDSEQG
jgi:CheY-like chemotaxis protein